MTVRIAQLVESRIVIPVVVGSSPISHPRISRPRGGNITGSFAMREKKNGYEGDAFTLHDESQTLSFMKKKRGRRAIPQKKTEILIFLSFPRGKQEPWGRVGGSTMFLVPSFFSLRAGMILTHQNLSFLRLLDWRAGVSGVLPDSADFFVPLLSCCSTDSDRWSFFVAFQKNETNLC